MSAYREKIVQWASRQACEVQQWTAIELIDGYRFERRQPGKKLPQPPRFGMSVAQGTFNVRDMCNFKQLGVAEIAHPTTTARLIGRSMSSDMARNNFLRPEI